MRPTFTRKKDQGAALKPVWEGTRLDLSPLTLSAISFKRTSQHQKTTSRSRNSLAYSSRNSKPNQCLAPKCPPLRVYFCWCVARSCCCCGPREEAIVPCYTHARRVDVDDASVSKFITSSFCFPLALSSYFTKKIHANHKQAVRSMCQRAS